jgi:UDP-3-O-[3-hydroxymyristoyl] glucosamine N-acyltransferase
MKNWTIANLIDQLGGTWVAGDLSRTVDHPAQPEQASSTSILFAESEPTLAVALAARPGLIVIPRGIVPSAPFAATAIVACDQPRLWFARAAQLLRSLLPVEGIHPAAVVATDARIAEEVTIGPCAVIGSGVQIGAHTRIEAGTVLQPGVTVGAECHLFPRVVVYSGTTLGDRVIVHAGAVLGADGFGYVRDRQTGRYTQFPQQGKLVIEDDVEIGANTTIDRGALDVTRIGRGVKLDNLVHIGHNCTIGEDVVMASLCGVSGSSVIGDGAILAGQVGVGDHVRIGPGVILGGQAGVLSGKTVTTTGTVLWGTPVRPLRQYLRELATLTRLARKAPRSTEE